MWNEYRKEYKVRGGVEMTGKGEPWHTKEEDYYYHNVLSIKCLTLSVSKYDSHVMLDLFFYIFNSRNSKCYVSVLYYNIINTREEHLCASLMRGKRLHEMSREEENGLHEIWDLTTDITESIFLLHLSYGAYFPLPCDLMEPIYPSDSHH